MHDPTEQRTEEHAPQDGRNRQRDRQEQAVKKGAPVEGVVYRADIEPRRVLERHGYRRQPAELLGGNQGAFTAFERPVAGLVAATGEVAGLILPLPDLPSLPKIGRWRQLPLLFQFLKVAIAVPGRDLVAEQPVEASSRFLLPDGDRPGRDEARRQGNAEAVPPPGRQSAQQIDFIVQPADAMTVAQGERRFAGRVERDGLHQETLAGQAVPYRTLHAAERPAAKVLPAQNAGIGPQQDVGAIAVILRFDHGDQPAAAEVVAQRRDHDVDLAARELLQPIRARHPNQPGRHAHRFGQTVRHVDVVAHQLAGFVAHPERMVVPLYADDQVSPCANLVQPVRDRPCRER